MVTEQKEKGKTLMSAYSCLETEKLPLIPTQLDRHKRKIHELEAENKKLRKMIEELQAKPRRSEEAEEKPVQPPKANDEEKEENKSVIEKHLLSKINRICAQKAVNDLLHGMHSQEYLASHCLTGSPDRKRLPVEEVNAITRAVLDIFPATTAAQVRNYMRSKMNNAAKVVARRLKVRSDKMKGSEPEQL